MSNDNLGMNVERYIHVDLAAIANNVANLTRLARPAMVMAVVKADAYGHGAVEVAKAAVQGGATWLGVAHVDEALPLRAAGVLAPILAWLHTPRTDFEAAVCHDVTLGISSVAELVSAADAAGRIGRQAVVHLKVDTGLGRNGSSRSDWPLLVAAARRLEGTAAIRVEGLFSHLAAADDASQEVRTTNQRDAFLVAAAVARQAGLTPDLLHIANTAATLRRSDLHLDMVRVGLGVYGLSPLPHGERSPVQLIPALSFHSLISSVKMLPAGHGVSYGNRYITARSTRVGLVPVGYGDGLPRSADTVSVVIGGRPFPIIGVVAMDQFMVHLGDPEQEGWGHGVRAGDDVMVISALGPNSVDQWATAAGTINYEIVARLAGRVPRRYQRPPPVERRS